MNEITPTTAESFYPPELQKAVNRFNSDLESLRRDRAQLTADSTALRAGLLAGKSKPEKAGAAVADLLGRRLALDVRELLLFDVKCSFKGPVLEARTAECQRLKAAAATREAEIRAKLAEAGIETRYEQGVVNTDRAVSQLRAAASELHSFENPCTPANAERAAELRSRIEAAVPIL